MSSLSLAVGWVVIWTRQNAGNWGYLEDATYLHRLPWASFFQFQAVRSRAINEHEPSNYETRQQWLFVCRLDLLIVYRSVPTNGSLDSFFCTDLKKKKYDWFGTFRLFPTITSFAIKLCRHFSLAALLTNRRTHLSLSNIRRSIVLYVMNLLLPCKSFRKEREREREKKQVN